MVRWRPACSISWMPAPASAPRGRGSQLSLPARRIVEAIEEADGLVVASPVYKGSLPGLFKHLFDLIDPTRTGGQARRHRRDRRRRSPCPGGGAFLSAALRFFGALQVPVTVYASDADFADGVLTDQGVRERAVSPGGRSPTCWRIGRRRPPPSPSRRPVIAAMLHRRHILSGLAGLALPTLRLKAARAAEPGVLRIGYQKNGILVVASSSGRSRPRWNRWATGDLGRVLLRPAAARGAVPRRDRFRPDRRCAADLRPGGEVDARLRRRAGGGGSGSGILLPKGSTLKSLADLKGKRVAFAKASSAHNLTVAALEKAGLTYADIEPVTLAPADAAAAFSRGSIDAWTIWDPYYAIAEAGDGVRVLATAQDIAPQNNFFLAGRSLAEQRPAVLSAAVGALERVAAWCTQNRGEVAALLSQGTGVPLAATRERSTAPIT